MGQLYGTALVYLVTNTVTFRACLCCQSKARSLRASLEAVIRGVMSLGKGWAIPDRNVAECQKTLQLYSTDSPG